MIKTNKFMKTYLQIIKEDVNDNDDFLTFQTLKEFVLKKFVKRRNGVYDGTNVMDSKDFISKLFEFGFKYLKCGEINDSDDNIHICFEIPNKYICLSIDVKNNFFAYSDSKIWNSNTHYVGLDNSEESLAAEKAFKVFFGEFFDFVQDKNGIFTITESKQYGSNRDKIGIEFDRLVRGEFKYLEKLSKKQSVPVIIHGNGTSYLFIDAVNFKWRTAGIDAFKMGANGW